MQPIHGMANCHNRSTCNHKECQRHAHLGIVSAQEQCKCLSEMNASSAFLENVLDMANTLAQIMIICGIHECKAKASVDVTTYAFLHFDSVCYCLDNTPKKRIRKEDLFNDLGKKCLMNRVEAHLAYTIIKRGFKAFYYKPSDRMTNDDGRPVYSEECVYVHAARKTAESYARYDGLSCQEQRGYEAKIRVAYKKFYDRMQMRKNKPVGDECNCCFCAKKRGHLVYGKKPPCDPTPSKQKKKPHQCPYCCRTKKQKLIHPGRATRKCPKCHRMMRFCVCPKYDFALDWVKSIWERRDMDAYVQDNILGRKIPDWGCNTEEKKIDELLKGCDSRAESVEEEQEEEEEGDEGVDGNDASKHADAKRQSTPEEHDKHKEEADEDQNVEGEKRPST